MNQCVALIIEKAPTLQKRNFGAKIQNGCKILSIDTYYKGKLAYPHFSNRETLLKLEAEGREFAKFLRSLEQFIQTMKDQNNFW